MQRAKSWRREAVEYRMRLCWQAIEVRTDALRT
jgi:hypothetical protein